MKRVILLTLTALLLIGAVAQAERLNMGVMDLLSVDAELPGDARAALPVLDAAPYAFDADLARALLMPDCTQRTDTDDPVMGYDVQFGTGSGDEEYMLVELTYGRIYYVSTFWQTQLRDVLSTGDPMQDTLNYYPDDREVAGFPRADALKQAEDLLSGLGIAIGTHLLPEPRVKTIDAASYDVMLQDLSQADAQADIPRRYLDAYDADHDGYLILYDTALGGVRLLDAIGNRPLALFISRQGVEYLETMYIVDVAQAGEPLPLLGAAQALTAAAPEMERLTAGGEYVAGNYISGYGKPNPSTVERIRQGYRLDQGRRQARPVWEYTFPRGVWNHALNKWNPERTWQTRSLDNRAFLGLIHVDAVTGEFIETLQG